MSVQTNQYLIYGVSLPYTFSKEWEKQTGKDFYETFEDFMDDSAFSRQVNHKDGIFCLFDGMSGRYIVIGRVIEKGDDDDPFIAVGEPLSFDSMCNGDQQAVKESIERNFGIQEAELKYWLITHYR